MVDLCAADTYLFKALRLLTFQVGLSYQNTLKLAGNQPVLTDIESFYLKYFSYFISRNNLFCLKIISLLDSCRVSLDCNIVRHTLVFMRSSRTWASDSSIPLVLGASSFEFWLFNWLREVVLLKSAVSFLSFSDQYHILTHSFNIIT